MSVLHWCRDVIGHRLTLLVIGLRAVCAASAGFGETSGLPQLPSFVGQTWRVENGLPQESVWAITQTRDGYLWIGTGGGLARFDGVRFKVFGLADGLPALHVRTLLEDRQGRLWVGTANGLARYEAGRFRAWTTRDGLAGDMIYELVEDHEGTIWIGTSTGLNCWRDEVITIPDPKITSVRVLNVDAKGIIWVARSAANLMRWEGGQFVPVQLPPQLQDVRPNRLLTDAVGRLWVAAQGSVSCLDGNTWRHYGAVEGLPDVTLLCFGAGADGTVWVGSLDQGLYGLFPGATRFHAVRRADGLADEAVRVVFEDRGGNLWVGTRSGGLTRLRPRRVTVWQIQDGETEAMPFSIAEAADGALVVGTVGRGLYLLRDGVPEPMLREELGASPMQTGAVFMTREDGLWFVAGAALFRWQDGQLRQILPGGGVSSLAQDDEGGVWIGTPNGRLRLFRNDTLEDFSEGLPRAALTALAPDHEGGLWVGAYGHGVIHLRGAERTSFGKADGLSSDLIRALYRDAEGVLWIGTEGGGLSRLQAGRIINFGKAEGMPEDTILQILEDDASHLWLASYRGIICVTRRELADVAAGRSVTLHPRLIGRSEGMHSEQCMSSFGAALKMSDGRLCFAAGTGLVVVDPKHHRERTSPPSVRVEKLVADGKALPLPVGLRAAAEQRDVMPSPPLSIEPGQQRLEFHYTGLFLSAPEKVRFRHRLIGLDPGWVEAGETRAAYYSYLPPGRYRFEVTAHSGSGIWSDPPVGFDLILRPFFWQTGWFLAACGLALGGVAVGVIRHLEQRRVRTRLQRLELEHAMERERTRIARDIHDDLGARLTKISMLTDLAEREAPSEHSLGRYVRSISSTARDMLTRLDETVWVVNPRNDQLDRLAEYLLHYAEDFFQHTPIRCRFKAAADLPPLPVAAEPRHHVFLSAKEALNNVVRHAGATEVLVQLEFANDRFSLTIRDNGRGFDAAECLARGRGLDNMRSRVENLGGRFELQSEPGQGTTVRMEFDVAASLQAKPAPGP